MLLFAFVCMETEIQIDNIGIHCETVINEVMTRLENMDKVDKVQVFPFSLSNTEDEMFLLVVSSAVIVFENFALLLRLFLSNEQFGTENINRNCL